MSRATSNSKSRVSSSNKMFRSSVLSTLSAFLLGCGALNAASTIQFYEPYFGGIADNLANASGVATNGMRWGIVVDTANNGFSGGGSSYEGYLSAANVDGFWKFGGTDSDDYYIAGAFTVDASILYGAGDFGSTPGFGSIVDNLVVSYPTGVTAGDSFALVWFDSNSTAEGAKYGFFTHASFILPANDGGNYGFTDPFQGPDPIRAASNTFVAVPEPSRALLLLGGVFGLMMRRRRM